MLKIDIISGFLGSGKTTFIKRLLKTKISNENVVLIENEFGEVSIDGALLGDSKIEVTELSQGCICCSLAGDFSKSLNQVIETYHPDRIIIEPSGVGKLSDVKQAVVDANLGEYLNSSICIVDAKRAKMYAKNFGEFFIDQIKNASVVVLSRTDIAKENELEVALEVVREYNAESNVITTPINEMTDEALFDSYEGIKDDFLADLVKAEHDHDEEECDEANCSCHHHHHDDDDDDDECCCHHHHHDDNDDDEECCCHHHHHDDDDDDDDECCCHHHHHDDDDDDDEECCCHHEHHHHDEEECDDPNCSCHHHHHHHGHDADEVFESVGIETVKVYDLDVLKLALNMLANTETFGIVVRAKGIVKTTSGWKSFNITPGELVIEDNAPISIGKACVIGSKLHKDEIKQLF